MKEVKIKYFYILLTILAVIASNWFGYFPIALIVGSFSVLIGIQLIKKAKLNLHLLLWLSLQIFFLCIAFSLLYYELGLSIIDSFVISLQNLFHFSIIKIPEKIELLSIFKIMASFEGFIGYLLIVSGISLMIKSKKK